VANNKSSKAQTLFCLFFLSAGVLALVSGCSSARKKTPELSKPKLSEMLGKRVALLEVAGEATATRIIETALVNQLIRTGSFILIPKKEVESARQDPTLDPLDDKALARKVGADYTLRAKVLSFLADNHEGYSSETVEDSQLAAERGDGKTERLYKVQSLDTEVRVQLDFVDLKTTETKSGIAEAKDRVVAEAKDSAIHLPPKLRALDKLAQEAFKQFFERYR
jgi:hypothetical protein